MAIQHRPNPHAPLHLPNDPRLTQDFGETNSPFGKKLQNEFKHYWTLRTKHTRSEAEDQQLSKLRQKIRQQTQTKHSTLTS
jgi:hypothetical protein